jgi:hypothetical protein
MAKRRKPPPFIFPTGRTPALLDQVPEALSATEIVARERVELEDDSLALGVQEAGKLPGKKKKKKKKRKRKPPKKKRRKRKKKKKKK